MPRCVVGIWLSCRRGGRHAARIGMEGEDLFALVAQDLDQVLGHELRLEDEAERVQVTVWPDPGKNSKNCASNRLRFHCSR